MFCTWAESLFVAKCVDFGCRYNVAARIKRRQMRERSWNIFFRMNFADAAIAFTMHVISNVFTSAWNGVRWMSHPSIRIELNWIWFLIAQIARFYSQYHHFNIVDCDLLFTLWERYSLGLVLIRLGFMNMKWLNMRWTPKMTMCVCVITRIQLLTQSIWASNVIPVLYLSILSCVFAMYCPRKDQTSASKWVTIT